ncbi:Hemicentin-1 [Armadillidium vulgare]|nr:Hemicentin-1 [Armadillidium vulgare]
MIRSITGLNVLEPPTIEEGPHEVVAVEGEVVTVFCSVSGNPSPKITWHNEGSQITEKMEETEEVVLKSSVNENILNDIGSIRKPTRGLLASGALQFSPILVNHAGNYSCVADNEAGSAKHEFPVSVLIHSVNIIKIKIISILYTVTVPPKVTLDLSSHVTTVGGSVEFFCKAKGSSPFTYSWKKERTPIHPGQEFQIMSNGTLVLHHVTLDMAGSYTCSARNPAGVGEDSQVLTVNELPKVSVASKEIIVAAGENAELECFAEGQPKPSISWSRPDLAGLEITPKDSRIQIIDNRLIISPVISEDMGTYQCTGTNRAGSESAKFGHLW